MRELYGLCHDWNWDARFKDKELGKVGLGGKIHRSVDWSRKKGHQESFARYPSFAIRHDICHYYVVLLRLCHEILRVHSSTIQVSLQFSHLSVSVHMVTPHGTRIIRIEREQSIKKTSRPKVWYRSTDPDLWECPEPPSYSALGASS